jgi:hypothetical protein
MVALNSCGLQAKKSDFYVSNQIWIFLFDPHLKFLGLVFLAETMACKNCRWNVDTSKMMAI